MFVKSTEDKFFESKGTFFDSENKLVEKENDLFQTMDGEETFFDKAFFFKEETEKPVIGHNQMCTCQTPVSYTHLDVYKRQELV